MDKDYYVGLDIGTNSVGWAVTDPEYNLCRFHKKDMWGIRLFEEAQTAADRRMKRTNRRRLQRRKQRIKLLQMLFAEEMYKVDPTFFIRLNESRLWPEDKLTGTSQLLFCDKDYTDRDFYKDYPTIYHLRKELLNSRKQHDIRLVYLALHHIIKSRGHFLINGDLESAKDFSVSFSQFLAFFNDNMPYSLEERKAAEIAEVLKDHKMAKSSKAKALEGLLSVTVSEEQEQADEKTLRNSVKEICKLIVGNQGDIQKVFFDHVLDVDESCLKFKFSDTKYDEQVVPELEQNAPDELALIEMVKTIYDWSVLVDILNDEQYFSNAQVKAYEAHNSNLRLLHQLIKKYCTIDEYRKMFDSPDEKANYANYVGSLKKGHDKIDVPKCTEEDFYKNLGKLLGSIDNKIEAEDRQLYESFIQLTEMHRLLPLQRSKDNGVVPKQIHEVELKKILENASTYLGFLNEKDSDGSTVSDKILAVFNYRIPYYVGPLSDRHRNDGANNWMTRKEDGYIYPWNIQDKVDYEKSNEEFIRRMTNKCTYLPWEDVLPKCSLLYSKFMVLNELNNLTIRGHKLGSDVALKQRIFHDLFERHNKVKGKMLLTYLQKDDADLTLADLGGFDIDFKASLASYIDFKNKVFGERINEKHIQDICEDIIKWATIYGNDSKMLSNVIYKHYGSEMTADQIKAASKLKYSGWGQFSKALLEDIEGTDNETGEMFSIIQGLWDTNNNFMQLLSSKYTFQRQITDLNKQKFGEITSVNYDALVKDIFTSPANKRAIWQSVLIVEEIRRIMGCQPKKIFVEMARGGEKERKSSRKQKLIDLYVACKEDARAANMLQEIESHDERDFNSMKLYLYYTQMGRCAYTGEPIDIDQLMSNNSLWDRDHIYPQSKIKDDSIDNLVLVKKVENAKKDNGLLSADILHRMYPIWKSWQERGFISKTKFEHLTRKDDFSIDELSGFVSRQLVETRQSTKLVADLLDRMYSDTKVIKVKAGLASDFRKAPLKVLKSRLLNDHHHAKDAYLNIVTGNVYSTRFTDNPREWVRKHRDEDWSINKVFYFDVEGAWKAPQKEKGKDGKKHSVQNENGEVITGTIDKVRKIVRQEDVLYTEYTYCGKGQLFDETIQSKDKATSIPLKNGLETAKYGGYTSPNTSYFAEIEFDGKKKGDRVKQIIGVPIYVASMLVHDPDAFIHYCERVKGLQSVKVLEPRIKKNSLLRVDGFPMRIRGENETNDLLKSNQQLILEVTESGTIRVLEKWIEKGYTTIDYQRDGLTDESLIRIYDVLTFKLLDGAFKKRPANKGTFLLENKKKFVLLNTVDKCHVIRQILNMLRCDNATTADLKVLGGSTNSGKIAINKNTMGKSELILINQSVTGLFENRKKL